MTLLQPEKRMKKREPMPQGKQVALAEK
jgi:hypothetical protein